MKAALQALQFQMAAPGTNPCHTPAYGITYPADLERVMTDRLEKLVDA
jgi:hypothetical protein